MPVVQQHDASQVMPAHVGVQQYIQYTSNLTGFASLHAIKLPNPPSVFAV